MIVRRMNEKEAASYVGLAYRTLNKMRVNGKGPDYYKVGRRVIYEDTMLDAWLESKRVK